MQITLWFCNYDKAMTTNLPLTLFSPPRTHLLPLRLVFFLDASDLFYIPYCYKRTMLLSS